MSGFDALVNDLFAASPAVWRRESEAPDSTGAMPGAPGPMIDEQAFHLLYRRTAGALRAYVARVLGNMTHADDIVQESYLRLVRSPPATDDPQQLRAFLFRVASRLIVDHWRRGRHERPEVAESPVLDRSVRAVEDEQPRLVPTLQRTLRDELRGELVVKLRRPHADIRIEG